jgi:hypothetical protein
MMPTTVKTPPNTLHVIELFNVLTSVLEVASIVVVGVKNSMYRPKISEIMPHATIIVVTAAGLFMLFSRFFVWFVWQLWGLMVEWVGYVLGLYVKCFGLMCHNCQQVVCWC